MNDLTPSLVRAVADEPRAPLPAPVQPITNGIRDAHPAPAPLAVAPITANLDQVLPRQVAYLRIRRSSDGSSGFEIEIDAAQELFGSNGQSHKPEPARFATYPRLNFVENLQPGLTMDRRQFWRDIKQLSGAYARVGAWLSQLFEATKNSDPLHLIIQDSIGLQFPWETLTFAVTVSGQRVAKRLGAAFTVTRWMPYTLTDSARDVTSPDALARECRGGVLAYISKDIDNQEERDTLLGYRGTLERDIHNFEAALTEPLDDCGLVYLGCHAQFAGGTQDASDPALLIGTLQDAAQQISLETLEYDMELQRILDRVTQSKPLVFINACHSGVSARQNTRTGVDQNLPRVFLQNAAQGVIVTLGFVDATSFAPQMAKRVLKLVADGTLSTAEALRKIRDEEHGKIQQQMAGRQGDPAHDDLKDFFNAFMYVYYGSPHTRLKLTAAGGG